MATNESQQSAYDRIQLQSNFQDKVLRNRLEIILVQKLTGKYVHDNSTAITLFQNGQVRVLSAVTK